MQIQHGIFAASRLYIPAVCVYVPYKSTLELYWNWNIFVTGNGLPQHFSFFGFCKGMHASFLGNICRPVQKRKITRAPLSLAE
jgi:hypothetical protein